MSELEVETSTTIDILGRHAENPSAFLAMNRDTRHFREPGIDGVIAYRTLGRRHLVQFGGAFAAVAQQAALLAAFRGFARRQRRSIISVQLTRSDAELYARQGFTVNQLGASYAKDLDRFSLGGRKFVPLRNKISRARRAGVTVAEVGVDDVPETALDAVLRRLDASWLHAKGRHVKELAFMVGERGGPGAPSRRLFLARSETGQVLAYISFSPVYGARAGWLHDLSRRAPDAPPGTLESIVVFAVERFRAEGARFLHFGFTPFTGLRPECEMPGHSRLMRRIVGLLAGHGAKIYPAADQLAYKEKWSIDHVEPEYIAFSGGVTIPAVCGLLRVTNVV